ncbi:hypothetical protein A9Q84_20395 [Halobacteriovorax marinus]|uniref:FHA domain-containing protein n=1 Tax=Halobacteriovorax marinus TaxID=97084 RepID=A0A1Y5F157_9BACT|nr:hypothetical protein A9Q84_20395 [Halobacteriovorax marinus]
MAIVLIIQDGDQTSRIKLTSRPITIGRSSKCDIKIDDDMCSGKHCALKINANSIVLVKDLESTNGTFLNDGKIMDTHLMLDDLLKIGNCEITIDRSELSPKEKIALTRDEPTAHIKFVSLTPEKKKVRPSQVIRAKKEAQAPNISPKISKPALKKEKQEIKPDPKTSNTETESKTGTMSLKDRIAAKGKKISKGKSVAVTENLSERQIDLEESSGATKLIKLEKPSTGKTGKSSIKSKIKNVFKKKKK